MRGSRERCTVIGSGELGGKAEGLLAGRDILAGLGPDRFAPIVVEIPALTVLATSTFDAFLERNRLGELVEGAASERGLAQAFQRAELPAEVVGDLWDLIRHIKTPLAVRSSSLLEDALLHPFAGIYETKMIPNNQPEAESRFRGLTEAIKLVYASTFLPRARAYLRAVGREPREEKMAVVLQEVVGRRHGSRFYPDVSGVARSWNFYAFGGAEPRDGAVSLALGLGKTIVDGGRSWTYSP
ncbi:MAG TPA: PEP/pyruvate-binding domain-containing protein, partial [Vicinamibacteria bacterium]